MEKESISSTVKDLQAEVITTVEESNSILNRRCFGHCIITWEIKNYGQALWQNNLKIRTPDFSIKGPNTQDTKWKLILQTELSHMSLVKELKVKIDKVKKDCHDSTPQELPKLKYIMKEHEKVKFDRMCSLVDNKLTDSKLFVKNLMLHLERAKCDDGPSRVWVDWKVCYIGITGEKYPLAHGEHIFNKKSGYGFNIGTLYDFEKDFDYNSGVMTILCEMIVNDFDTDVHFHDDMNIDLHALSEDLQTIFDQGKLCDAEIIVDDKKLKVHKAVLCSHSEFFKKLFETSSKNAIEIPGIKYDDMVKILEYVYSHEIKDIVGKPSLSLIDSVIQMNLKDLAEHFAPEEHKIHTVIDMRKLTFPWSIQNISTNELNCISSPILSNGTDDLAWQIHLYPKGVDGNSEYIAISVECIEGKLPDDLCIQCAVMRENGDLNFWKTLENSEEVKNVFENEKFIPRESAINMSTNDVLQIGLKVRTCIGKESYIDHTPCTPVLYNMKKSFENMVNCMFSLQQSSKYADVVLKFEKEEIKAHKFILSARSYLLAKQLEETNIVSLSNISPTIFKILLDYMYCATLNVSDIDTIIDVYKAAEEFIIPRLQEKCSRILQERVTCDNVRSILRLADEYCDEYLKMAVDEFVKVNEKLLIKHAIEKIKLKRHLMWREKEEISKVGKSVVKKIFIKKYTKDNIVTYDFEIDPETLSARNGWIEKKKTLTNLPSKEMIPPYKIIEATEKESGDNEKSDMEKPVTCEINTKSKMHTDKFNVPLKKRYRNEPGFLKNSEENVAVEVSQSCEIRNGDESANVDLKISPSPSKTSAEEKEGEIHCEVKNGTEINCKENLTNDISTVQKV